VNTITLKLLQQQIREHVYWLDSLRFSEIFEKSMLVAPTEFRMSSREVPDVWGQIGLVNLFLSFFRGFCLYPLRLQAFVLPN
jgi:hypothetical protein